MKKKLAIIKSLTSLRFFAALGVFFHHLDFLNSSSLSPIKNLVKYSFNGYVGVSFFYILSGFIISYSFKRHQENGVFGYSDFMVFRISRLFPVHVLGLLVFIFCFGIYLHFDEINIPSLLSNTFLIHAFIPHKEYYFSFNSVSWSISCELFFYVAFCFLVRLKSKHLLALLSVILTCIIYSIIIPPAELSQHWLFYINPVFRLPDFIIGMLLCRVYLATSFSPSTTIGNIMELTSIALLGITVYISSNFISDMNLRFDLLFIPAMASIVMAFSYNSGLLSKILSHPFMMLLGEASFSFYMIHWIILSKTKEIITPNPSDYISILSFIGVTISLSIILSISIHKGFELPLNKKIRELWIKAKHPKIASTSLS
ncbi:acyltransferase family protein [Aeromonas veronii]|uniref:acyltransferase family protein n=1 Tax=Aeromonas veronii TaxID=654 RepID=UPI001F18103A|nr:acyltransferase [Aeromonas veronii]MCF5857842.1 acyltransferase [Aeromonas veronii]